MLAMNCACNCAVSTAIASIVLANSSPQAAAQPAITRRVVTASDGRRRSSERRKDGIGEWEGADYRIVDPEKLRVCEKTQIPPQRHGGAEETQRKNTVSKGFPCENSASL
jgi:hypothetical protein